VAASKQADCQPLDDRVLPDYYSRQFFPQPSVHLTQFVDCLDIAFAESLRGRSRCGL
jgi:hypothetical protein